MRRLVSVVIMAGTVGACEEELVLTTIELVPHDTTIWQDETAELAVEFYDQHGGVISVLAADAKWQSGDPSVLAVNEGLVVPVGHGAAMVTVSAPGKDGPVEGQAAVTIRQVHMIRTAAAYITQVNQNPTDPIPLIAMRKGILRVHATYTEPLDFDPPEARVVLKNGDAVLVDTILQQVTPEILQEIDQSDYDHSYNLEVPAEHVREGLAAQIIYDPHDRERVIAGGDTVAYQVVELSVQKQMMVPVVAQAHPNRRPEDWVADMVEDGSTPPKARAILPIADQLLVGHETFETDLNWNTQPVNSWSRLLNELENMRIQEGNLDHYYYGAFKPPYRSGIFGIAYGIGHPVSAGDVNQVTFSHETGHSMNLYHAPCGGAGGPDPDFPHQGGSIGFWGWNPRNNALRDPDRWNDIMGYCRDTWVSPYHFDRAMKHRLGDGADTGYRESVLVLSGTIANGIIELEPAFMAVAPANTGGGGPCLVEGHAQDGGRAFAYRFTPHQPPHLGDGRLFTLRIPMDDLDLASVTVSGPEGSVALTEGSTPPMAMMIDSDGQVRAMRRNWDGSNPNGWQVVVSTGLPR